MTERFGSYELVRKIAQGGMAEVFLAKQTGDLGNFSRQVAIKRIYPHLAHEPDLIAMFFDEARIASRLNHPNIVQIYELGEERGYFYIAMEFVHGCDLRSLCERGIKRNNFLPLNLAVRIVADAAAGLHYAHTRLDERGKPMHIVHRDISPQNILVGMNGAVKVCDFGIAKAESRIAHTRTGQFKGKFAYMSPEQVIGDGRPIDLRSDIFSLGIVLYEITVCARLFRARNDYETIKLVTEATVPRPSAGRPDFPPDLERIVLRALAKHPKDRYQSAEQLQSDLEDWLIDHRARTSAMHTARYMAEVNPDLVEQQLYQHEFDATRPELAVDHQRLASAARAAGVDIAELDASDATRPVRVSEQAATTDPTVQTPSRLITGALPSIKRPQSAAAASQAGDTTAPLSNLDLIPELDADTSDEDATHDVNAEAFRRHLLHDQNAEGSYPSSDPRTPLPPRDRQMTPGAFQSLGLNLERQHQLSQQSSGLQVDPHRDLRWTPAQGLPAVQPPGSSWPPAGQPSAPPMPNAPLLGQLAGNPDLAGSSGSSMEIAISKLKLDRNQRTLRYMGLAGLGILLLIGLALAVSYGGNKDALVVPQKPALPSALPDTLHMPVSVALATTPGNAHVVVNGQNVQGSTPGLFPLAEGEDNEVLFYLGGHRPQRAIIKGDAASDLQPFTLISERPTPGKLAIQTTPEAAQISINGERVAQTPLRLETIPAGMEHHIVLEKEGFGRIGAFIHLATDKPTTLDLTLRPPERSSLVDVVLDGTPRGAIVLVNGEARAQLPATITLPRDGLHTIRVEAREHEPAEHILSLDPYGAFIWQVRLAPIVRERGSVALQVNGPAGASVFIGNNSHGKAPIRKVELPEGEYPIIIQDASGKRYEGRILVYPNTLTRYRLTPTANGLDVERQR